MVKALNMQLGLLAFLLFCIHAVPVLGQKVLSEQETRWVNEANGQLQDALSNPAMSQDERMRIVERSARTLKEYGQPSAFPSGTIPLKITMESNYNQIRREYEDANDLYKYLSTKLVDQQLKIVNTLQIEVAEEQIKIMLPGLPAPYELSKELVSTFFKWDIAEGFNQGTYGDAKSLAARFKKLAETKELIKVLESMRKSQQMSVQNLHSDLQMVGPLEAQLRKKYEISSASTRVMQGYEGAKLNLGSSGGKVASSPVLSTELKQVSGNINEISICVSGNGLLNYSGMRLYDGDRNRLISSDYVVGFMSLGNQSYNGDYAQTANFSGSGASLASGNLNFTSSWQAKGVLRDECCEYDAKCMVQVEGKYSDGVLTELKIKETSIHYDYESEESIQIVYNQEKWVELVNIPIKKYPEELNRKFNTNYLYYAEIEGNDVKNKVKVLRDEVSVKSSSKNMENSSCQLLPLNWESKYGNYKLQVYLGSFKNFERNW